MAVRGSAQQWTIVCHAHGHGGGGDGGDGGGGYGGDGGGESYPPDQCM